MSAEGADGGAGPPQDSRPTTSKTIVGVLFVESLWARMGAAERRARRGHAPSPLDPRYMPPEDVFLRLGALATLLRAFADEGDVLWTPRRVVPERMPDVPGVARPLLVYGPRPTPGAGDIAWGYATGTAAAANDRRLALEVQRELGCALPAARVVADPDDLDEAVAAAAAAAPGGTWIAKAAHSSAGRGRVGARGPDLQESHRRGIERLLELHGAVVVEPWMPRIADFGAAADVVDGGAAQDLSLHVLENTARGDFRGIAFPPAGLRDTESAAILAAAEAAARALDARGYTGPFGIDAFRYRDREGGERFHPLCEINARLTFGRVARTLAAKILAATGLPAGAPWRFRVGNDEEFRAARAEATPGRFFPLLLPGPPDGVAAWLRAEA